MTGSTLRSWYDDPSSEQRYLLPLFGVNFFTVQFPEENMFEIYIVFYSTKNYYILVESCLAFTAQ